MSKNKKRYYAFNLIILLISILFLGYYLQEANRMPIDSGSLIVIIFVFILLHIIKYIRQYLIFLEEKISFKRYTKLYIKTTFVNIMLPFKSGELFKMYSYGHEIHNYKKGILGVLIDRFLDTIVLLFLLVPCELIYLHQLSGVTTALLCFIVTILILVSFFPSSYVYLNKFLVTNPPSKKSLYLLKMLEYLHDIYTDTIKLLKGRVPLLVLLSIIGWIVEYGLIKFIAEATISSFDASIFAEYVNSAFFNGNNPILTNYLIIGSVLFFIIALIVYGVSCYTDRRYR